MLFKPEFIEKILNGTKCQTRRLVKEGEIGFGIVGVAIDNLCSLSIANVGKGKIVYFKEYNKKVDMNVLKAKFEGKIKWQVGKDYSVQAGRGKPGMRYCPKCKQIPSLVIRGMFQASWYAECKCQQEYIYEAGLEESPLFDKYEKEAFRRLNLILLRIVITGIRKEKLLDISEEDAKKEGFDCRFDFLKRFYEINSKNYKDFLRKNDNKWDPNCLVLDFKVKT